jgi:hypothetical protein
MVPGNYVSVGNMTQCHLPRPNGNLRAMNPEANCLLTSLFAAGTRAQLDPGIRTVGLEKGQFWRSRWSGCAVFTFPPLASSPLVPFTDGSSVQAGVVGADGVVGAPQALGGGVSPSKIVVQMPGRAAVIEAAQIGKIAKMSERALGVACGATSSSTLLNCSSRRLATPFIRFGRGCAAGCCA